MKLALMFLLPLLAHAGFGDKIGNGGGLWACKRGEKIVKAQLVDLFEAEREFLLKIPASKGKDPVKAYRAKKAWVQKNLPDLYAQLEPSFAYVEKNLKIVRAKLEPIDDHGDFRSRPPAAECAGRWQYTQFANSNDSGEVMVQADLWQNRAISITDKAALLVHEAVYRWLRTAHGESDSNHTRKITGLLFAELPAAEMAGRIGNILAGLPQQGHDGAVDDSLGFLLRSQNEFADELLHQADAAYGQKVGTGNFSSTCRVPPGVTGQAADIFCILEANELDLYFTDISLELNVPTNACSYLRFTPYSFFSYQPGEGPKNVRHAVTYDGRIKDIENTRDGVAVCPYDYSATGGPNCCTGNYTHEVTLYASDGSSTVTSIAGTWPGNTAGCVAGPGKLEELGGSADQLPRSQVLLTRGVGASTTLHLPALGSVTNHQPRLLSSVFTGNFYNPVDHLGGKPLAMRPAAGFQPQDTYQWECLDGAGSVKARIRLMIREWNTAPIQEGGSPDLGGPEDGFDAPINDLLDWKDFGNTFPGARL